MNVYVKSVAESGVSAMDLLEAELKKTNLQQPYNKPDHSPN